MTEKRFINDVDNGKLVDTKGELSTIHYSDVVDFYELWEFLNKLNDENEKLNQFPVKLENRIQKLHKDLQKLTEIDKSDLNPQAVQDVATVISISLDALIEFKKELME